MDDFIKELSKESSFSITRNNKVIHLTISEVIDCLFYNYDSMGRMALLEACAITGRILSEEAMEELQEQITLGLCEVVEEKLCRIAEELF